MGSKGSKLGVPMCDVITNIKKVRTGSDKHGDFEVFKAKYTKHDNSPECISCSRTWKTYSKTQPHL